MFDGDQSMLSEYYKDWQAANKYCALILLKKSYKVKKLAFETFNKDHSKDENTKMFSVIASVENSCTTYIVSGGQHE